MNFLQQFYVSAKSLLKKKNYSEGKAVFGGKIFRVDIKRAFR